MTKKSKPKTKPVQPDPVPKKTKPAPKPAGDFFQLKGERFRFSAIERYIPKTSSLEIVFNLSSGVVVTVSFPGRGDLFDETIKMLDSKFGIA